MTLGCAICSLVRDVIKRLNEAVVGMGRQQARLTIPAAHADYVRGLMAAGIRSASQVLS